MKAKDLIVELSKLDPELEIMLAADPEGNRYWKVDGLETAGQLPVIWPGEEVEEADVYPWEQF